jgi:sigma-B regulation protein RsbU (phosphoserine phosphatase)
LSDVKPDRETGDPTTGDLEDLYENAPCGYLSIKPDGRIVKVNATFSTWMGWAPEQLIGKRFLDLLNIAGRIFYETHFAPMLRMQGFFYEVALDCQTQQGKCLPVLVNAVERRDNEGRHLFTRITVFNATDRRRYEGELLAARTAADAAKKEAQELRAVAEANLLGERETSALREQFIAVLGHDLRNPLSAISGGAELLLRRPLDDRTQSIATLIQRSAGRMAGLIDDVMDFARGRLGGGLAFEPIADAPIEAMLRQVVNELQTSAPDRVIQANVALSTSVTCDVRRIGQLASNLLGNAIAYGAPDKPIQLGATTSGDYFELITANAGDPIPPAVLAKIFEPFQRGSLRGSLQGLGLGLYISREIAKAHGGNLSVSSDEAETRFTFRMPLVPLDLKQE